MRKKLGASFKRIPYKYFVSLCVLGLIGILLFAFAMYSYYDYQEEYRQAAGREAQYQVNRIVSQIDEKMDNLKQYYITSMEEDEIKWILENHLDYSDYSYYKDAVDIMASTKLFGDYVSGFTFANFKTGWVLSNKGMFPMYETYNKDVLYSLFEQETERIGKNYWVYDNNIYIENTVDRKYRLTIETEGLSLIVKLPLSNLNVYGMFIANINMDTWKGDLQKWLYDNEELVVINPDGEIIFSTDEQLNVSCQKLQAESLTFKEPQAVDIEGISSYMVSSKVSSVLGWEYYVFYDMNEKGQLPGIRFSWAAILLVGLLVAICFVAVFHLIYSPIGKLVKNVADTEQKISGNELEFLADRFANLRDDKQILETVLNQQQDKVQELFELRLIRGEVRSSEEWEEYFEGLHLQSYHYFATAVMVLDLRSDNEASSNVNEDAICLKIVEELPEQLKGLTWMPLVYNACTIFGLFGDDDEDMLLKRVTEFYNGIQEYVEKQYGFRILMGVSATHTDFRHIRAAYRESVNALTMQSKAVLENVEIDVTETVKHVVDEDCHFYLASTTINGNNYNNSFEKEIQIGIKAVDKLQCYKVTDEFSLFLKGISVQDEALIYILRYVNTIMLTGIDAGVDMEKLYPDGLKKAYRELIEVIEPARVRRYIKYMFIDRVIQARNELLEKSSYSMMEEIEKKIAETKGNITLTECAEALGVHQTYIWKVLKMEKGKSFSDYLEEYKLNEAKRLLLQTDLTVAEIAAELNYTNAQNFIRFFSKGTGVTPGKFRKLY